jgi:hypothetical protein
VANSLLEYCRVNGYGGVTKECIDSAFQSENPKIVEQAKRYKLNKMVKEK